MHVRACDHRSGRRRRLCRRSSASRRQLPDARQRPGFAGFYLLVDDRAGTVVTISLWETREEMDAVSRGTPDGAHREGVAEAGVGSWRLETDEVPVHS